MVPKGPHGPKRILNGQKHLGLQLRTLLDLFGMLTSLTCLAIFVCFIGAFYLGHPLPKLVWLSATEGEIGKGGGHLGDLTTGQRELKLHWRAARHV